MILGATIVLCLLALTADGSPIKGRHELGDSKRLSSPVELRRTQHLSEQDLPAEQRETSKTSELPNEKLSVQKLESFQGHQEGVVQVKREDLAVRAPARPTEADARELHQARIEDGGKELSAVKKPAEEQPRLDAQSQQREEQQLLQGQKQDEPAVPGTKALRAALPAGAAKDQSRNEPSQQQQQQPQQREDDEIEWPKVEQGERHSTEAARSEFRSEERTRQQLEQSQQVRDTSADFSQQAEQVELRQDLEQRRFEGQLQQSRYDESAEKRHDQQVVHVQDERRVESVKGGPVLAEAEPYAFDYSIEGSSRRETGDIHGVVRGQYTLLNGDGSQRVVDYVADRDGFRATVNTGEPGTESQQPANVIVRSSQPAAQDISLHLEGKTREFLTAVPLLPVSEAGQAPILVAHESAKTVLRVDQPFIRQKPLKEETSKQEPSKDEATKQEINKQEVLRAEASRQEVLTKDAAKQEPPRQDTIKQELPKQEAAAKQEELQAEAAPKRAEPSARTPKSLQASAELRNPAIQARASFESATAHRPVVHTHSVSSLVSISPHSHSHHRHTHQPAPLTSVHHIQHVAPSRHIHVAPQVRPHPHHHHAPSLVPVVSRAQLQHDRYPPAPGVAVRAHQRANPRVSLYADNSGDEQPAGFD